MKSAREEITLDTLGKREEASLVQTPNVKGDTTMARTPKKLTPVEVEKETPPEDAIMRSRGGILTLPNIRTQVVTVLIIGTAPLIVHKFSEKMRKRILAKHMGDVIEDREPKDPQANFEAARYRLTDGTDGIPAGGLKAAIVSATGRDTGIAVSKAKGAFRVAADDPATNLCRILSPSPPRMREDVVRNDSGVVDIRHRPEFFPWACLVKVQFLPAYASAKRVLAAIQMAGFRVGLCEWRPASPKSLSGSYGTFRLARPDEVTAFEDGLPALWELIEREGVEEFIEDIREAA